MPLQVPPATDVLLLVFAAWAAGTIWGGALTRSWGEVDAGHFKVIWLVGAGLAGVAGIWDPFAWGLTALSLGTFAGLYRGFDAVAGAVASAAGAGLLAEVVLRTMDGGLPLLAFAFASALFLGAVTNAMLLGHWHLNQPRLGTGPLKRLVAGLWAGLGAYTVAGVLLLVNGLRGAEDVAVVGAITGVAFTVFTAVLTAMVTHLVRIRSIQSATGILYLEILLVFIAAFTGTLGALADLV